MCGCADAKIDVLILDVQMCEFWMSGRTGE
jgi:hypothetical protein